MIILVQLLCNFCNLLQFDLVSHLLLDKDDLEHLLNHWWFLCRLWHLQHSHKHLDYSNKRNGRYKLEKEEVLGKWAEPSTECYRQCFYHGLHVDNSNFEEIHNRIIF